MFAISLIIQFTVLIASCLLLWYYLEQLRSVRAGSPYIVTSHRDVKTIMRLMDVSDDMTVYDLGSGDGRIVLAAAARGAKATGFEINGFAASFSRFKIYWYHQKHAHIIHDSFFNHSLKQADVVFVYLLPDLINRLKDTLEKELPRGARVVSKSFPIPGWKSETSPHGFFIYTIGNHIVV